MAKEAQTEYDKIWAILHAMAEWENQIEIRANQRMDKIERKHVLDMARENERHKVAMARADRADNGRGRVH